MLQSFYSVARRSSLSPLNEFARNIAEERSIGRIETSRMMFDHDIFEHDLIL